MKWALTRQRRHHCGQFALAVTRSRHCFPGGSIRLMTIVHCHRSHRLHKANDSQQPHRHPNAWNASAEPVSNDHSLDHNCKWNRI